MVYFEVGCLFRWLFPWKETVTAIPMQATEPAHPENFTEGTSSYAIGAERRDEATYMWYTPDIAHGIVVEFLSGRVSSYTAYWY